MQQQGVFNQGLIDFLSQSVTPMHAIEVMRSQLLEAGFTELQVTEPWSAEAGQGYFLVQGERSLVAWRQGQEPLETSGLRLMGAHTDSPCLKVKPQAELNRHGCWQLGVEVYGGVLLHPWFDRDLCLAGQVHYLDADGHLQARLFDSGRPLGMVPSLAIHLNREANEGIEVNPQKHLPVVLAQLGQAGDTPPSLRSLLAEWLQAQGVSVAEVVDYDLSFYDAQPPALVGLKQEYISSARLDNLLSCFVGLQALLATPSTVPATAMLVCNDHEEVGSASAIGADGPLLEGLLRRLSGDEAVYQNMLSRSLMVSCDNAHALHPNFSDRHDENHGPKLNAGPVIKINANQRYATSSETSALFAGFCRAAGVPFQRFVVRSDMGCGSTIGPITATRLGVRVVDVGAPQWAMHSIRETAGSQDAAYLTEALKVFLASAQV